MRVYLFIYLTLTLGAPVAAELASPAAADYEFSIAQFFTGPGDCAARLAGDEPILTLDDVVLRRARASDRNFLVSLLGDPLVIADFLVRERWSTRDRAQFIDGQVNPGVRLSFCRRRGGATRCVAFVIATRAEGLPVGLAELGRTDHSGVWEFGYAIARRHRGRGYASAVAAGLVAFIRSVDARPTIVSEPLATNAASRRVLQKCGFATFGGEVMLEGRREPRVMMRWVGDTCG